MVTSDNSSSRKRVALALPILLALATPAAASFSIAYAPASDLEALDVALLGSARSTIDMAAYELTDPAVIGALTAAAERGVHLRLFRERFHRRPHGEVAAALARLAAEPNVELRIKRGPLMHLKSYLVDGHVLRGGAANFSLPGLQREDNDRFETDDVAAVKAFQSAFEAAWNRQP